MSRDGAFSPDHVYTHADIRALVTYAAARGVRVVPEFDTPGHVDRGWESLGVLTRCYDDAGEPADTGPLDPTSNRTYEVLAALYAEIAEVFAPETFVHVGGDEVPPECWASNPSVAAWMAAHPEVDGFAGLETLFEQRLLTMLEAQGSSYIVWQEIFGKPPPPLAAAPSAHLRRRAALRRGRTRALQAHKRWNSADAGPAAASISSLAITLI